MNLWGAITWDVARAGGFVAYGLITLSIVLGLVLSMRWRSPKWPRWATTDLHRYVTLLALVFTGVHSLAIWLDPFMAFRPTEILIPFASHYRPIWVALGIVAAYLMLAIWLSERIQRRIGYEWWRRLHYLTFGIYALATVHGIGTGSDTRTGWALLIYAGSFLLIGSLLAIRLLVPAPHLRPRPRVAGLVALSALAVAAWTAVGPLRPGWNAAANLGRGSGGRIALAQAGPQSSSSTSTVSLPFTAQLHGNIAQEGGGDGSGDGGLVTLHVNGQLSGGIQGLVQINLQGQPTDGGALAVQSANVRFAPNANGPVYQGQVRSMSGNQLSAVCIAPNGKRILLTLQIQADSTGSISGTVRGTSV